MQRTGRTIATLAIGALLAATTPVKALQCVPFARQASGISLRGDAWTWWAAAAGEYERGQMPRVGAVVVFKKHGAMRYGHVAVVTRMVNSREVLVEHANWASHRGHGRGQIAKMVAVLDISPRNDWTEVRVWNSDSQDFGTRVYPTYGFIYPHVSYASVQTVSLQLPPQPLIALHAVEPAKPPAAEQSVEPPRTEPKPRIADAKPADPPKAEPVKPADSGIWEGDAAAATRFGSGRYGH
jgi:surface antigen